MKNLKTIQLGLIFGLMFAVGCGSDQSNRSGNTKKETISDRTIPSLSKKQINRYLKAINDARSQTQNCGTEGYREATTRLNWNDDLYKSAYEHSRDMAVRDYTSHDGSGTSDDWTAQDENLGRGSHFNERIIHNGYNNYRFVGENYAVGADTPEEVVKNLLGSDKHCANLMNPKYKDVGMAHYKKNGTKYYIYWTQCFGSKD